MCDQRRSAYIQAQVTLHLLLLATIQRCFAKVVTTALQSTMPTIHATLPNSHPSHLVYRSRDTQLRGIDDITIAKTPESLRYLQAESRVFKMVTGRPRPQQSWPSSPPAKHSNTMKMVSWRLLLRLLRVLDKPIPWRRWITTWRSLF